MKVLYFVEAGLATLVRATLALAGTGGLTLHGVVLG